MTILFVCTGNTCRSPMAQVLCKKAHPDWTVFSQGLMADEGSPASAQAQAAMEELGCDLSGHTASMVNREDIKNADYVYGLTEAHVQLLRQMFPDCAHKIVPLADYDIDDPFGSNLETYIKTANQLQAAIDAL